MTISEWLIVHFPSLRACVSSTAMNALHSATNGNIHFTAQFTPTARLLLNIKPLIVEIVHHPVSVGSMVCVCFFWGGRVKMMISRTHCRLYRCETPVL